MENEQIIIAPLLTEKSLRARTGACYVFRVNLLATKVAVKQAVEKCFKVKVIGVSTCLVRPKRRVMGRSIGRTAGWKKAYVTLAKGQKIQELEA
ncbi:MAG: 50S ribosomal protein L23 [Candidatus Margulisbacteria bacterium]|jgi:large subunit ribosomal protein L23|nr:50S ribosomal protein L23 [Candidatus Margulisiibacteriota bacterium]